MATNYQPANPDLAFTELTSLVANGLISQALLNSLKGKDNMRSQGIMDENGGAASPLTSVDELVKGTDVAWVGQSGGIDLSNVDPSILQDLNLLIMTSDDSVRLVDDGTFKGTVVFEGAGNNAFISDGANSITVQASKDAEGTVTSGNDTIITGGGKDNIAVGNGDNFVSSGGGNDTITAGTGSNKIFGGAGNDLITVGNAVGAGNLISGQAGNDTITAGSGDDSISGGAGNDTINAGNGDNFVGGGAGNDSISAGSGNDSIAGGIGNDTVNAGSGADTVLGGDGVDKIQFGASGGDYIDGGLGNDLLTVTSEDGSTGDVAYINGGAGTADKLDLSNLTITSAAANQNADPNNPESITASGVDITLDNGTQLTVWNVEKFVYDDNGHDVTVSLTGLIDTFGG